MNKKLYGLGIAGSAIYIGGWITYFLRNWSSVVRLDPNELGDYLGGTLGPLATFWLILGFFQQSEQLRLTTQELQAQAKERTEAAKPRFHFLDKGPGGSAGAGQRTWRVEVHNTGPEAIDVLVTLDPHPFLSLRPSAPISHLVQGTTDDVFFHATAPGEKTTARMRVNYLNVQRQPGMATFTVSLDGNVLSFRPE